MGGQFSDKKRLLLEGDYENGTTGRCCELREETLLLCVWFGELSEPVVLLSLFFILGADV
ncbi:hypothetical protein D3C80_1788520 [compost metagenome]